MRTPVHSYNGVTFGILSETSSMDAWSFSLPAGDSCPGKVDKDPSNICFGCYAQINRYNMNNVLGVQHIRHTWLKDKLQSADGTLEVYYVIRNAIATVMPDGGYFRGHDSGDFYHHSYVELWYHIAKSLPNVKFWFPTRSHRIPHPMWRFWFNKLNSLPNVVIRPSALSYNEAPPVVEGFAAGSTVVSDASLLADGVSLCPKTVNGGSCTTNNCRDCWDTPGKAVAYLVHGWNGSSNAPVITDKVKTTRARIKGEVITALTIGGAKLDEVLV